MVAFDLVILVPIAGIVWFVLRGVEPRRRLKVSLWFAFYFTVPLAIYDWLYCGLYLGHGMRFVGRFWYLSVYYAIPWAVLPLVALMLDQRSAKEGHDGGTN